METIIRYLEEEFIKKLIEMRQEFYKDPTALSDFVMETQKEVNELARKYIERIPERMQFMNFETVSDEKRKLIFSKSLND